MRPSEPHELASGFEVSAFNAVDRHPHRQTHLRCLLSCLYVRLWVPPSHASEAPRAVEVRVSCLSLALEFAALGDESAGFVLVEQEMEALEEEVRLLELLDQSQ